MAWRNGPQLSDGDFWPWMQDAYVDLATPSTEIAGEIGVSYFDAAAVELAPSTVTPEAPPPARLKANARWAMSEGNATTGLVLLKKSFVRTLYGAFNTAVAKSVENEPAAKWARVARADACPFCRMIATRHVGEGATFYTKASTAAPETRYHDKCRCMATAIRPGRSFSPPSYTHDWDAEYQDIRKEVGGGPDAILAEWSRRLSA